MKAPLISIIVPVYNVENYLEACLDSIKNQSLQDFELIIVNDCSPDKSADIIARFAEDNPQLRIQLINHSHNRGLSGARNSGMAIAKGDYLFFLDSDDEITENCFESLMSCAGQSQPDIIVGTNYIIESNNEKRIVDLMLTESSISGRDILNTFCQRQWYNVPWNKLYKRNFIQKHNMQFAEGMNLEDELWSLQVASLAETACFSIVPTYNYYIRPKSIMSTYSNNAKRWQMFLEICRLQKDFLFRHSLENNIYVQRYFFENLLVIINGFQSSGQLDTNKLQEIVTLNFVSPITLAKHGVISKKASVAYLYFILPQWIALTYKHLIDKL